MSTIDYFKQFYNSLDTFDLTLLWLVVFACVFLIVVSINLYKKNKQLIEIIKKKEQVESMQLKFKNDSNNINEEKLVVEDIIKEVKEINSKIDSMNRNNNNIDFIEEVTRKMKEELRPQTIELTEFEKGQEDTAIISYKELVDNSSEKIYNISDNEETTDFINELKSFRSSL